MIEWHLESRADLPYLTTDKPPTWLSQAERSMWLTIKGEKRKQEWLLGHWTIKRLAWAYFVKSHWIEAQGHDWREIRAIQVDQDAFGAPSLSWVGFEEKSTDFLLCNCNEMTKRVARMRISISHSGEWSFCALGIGMHGIGVDIELIQQYPAVFSSGNFTEEEQEWIADLPHELHDEAGILIWSAREAIYKSIGVGLPGRNDINPGVTSLPEKATLMGLWRNGSSRGIQSTLSYPIQPLDQQRWNGYRIIWPTQDDSIVWLGFWRKIRDYILTVAVCVPNPIIDPAQMIAPAPLL